MPLYNSLTPWTTPFIQVILYDVSGWISDYLVLPYLGTTVACFFLEIIRSLEPSLLSLWTRPTWHGRDMTYISRLNFIVTFPYYEMCSPSTNRFNIVCVTGRPLRPYFILHKVSFIPDCIFIITIMMFGGLKENL